MCPPCKKEIQAFNDIYLDFKKMGVVIIGISVDREGLGVINDFLIQQPIYYHVALYTQEVWVRYQSLLQPEERGAIPITFIIDRNGFIQYHFIGYHPKSVYIDSIRLLLE